MRLIDADALIKRAAMRGHCLRPLVTAYHMCVDVKDIEKAPTIDAVEVVRCKDCKHYGREQELCHGRVQRFCELHKGLVIVDKHTFCSYGERRDDNA